MVPKTVPYKKIKAAAAAKRAQLSPEGGSQDPEPQPQAPSQQPNGKKHKSRASLNGGTRTVSGTSTGARPTADEDGSADPNDQLQSEMRQARVEDDVEMTG
jgi:DNA polymerase epsilon subunit 4